MAAAPQQEFSPTDRVLIAKQRATVRYVGPVDGYEGTWVGVEWDDSSRGKHDGETGGRRYFTCCCDAPTAASFVRINKVCPGISLVEALVLRYTNQLAEGQSSSAAAADAEPAHAVPASNRKLWVELVGQEQVTARQSKLELLTSARLVGANVSAVVRRCLRGLSACLTLPPGLHRAHVISFPLLSSASTGPLPCLQGPPGKLSATAPSLRQLDLTDNLIGGWSTVVGICQQLPQLQLLNLSLNRLQLPVGVPDAGLQRLPGLQCLVLNNCDITWQQVWAVFHEMQFPPRAAASHKRA